jgi:hypothetical protein
MDDDIIDIHVVLVANDADLPPRIGFERMSANTYVLLAYRKIERDGEVPVEIREALLAAIEFEIKTVVDVKCLVAIKFWAEPGAQRRIGAVFALMIDMILGIAAEFRLSAITVRVTFCNTQDDNAATAMIGALMRHHFDCHASSWHANGGQRLMLGFSRPLLPLREDADEPQDVPANGGGNVAPLA